MTDLVTAPGVEEDLLVDSELPPDRFGRPPVVAGQHHHINPHRDVVLMKSDLLDAVTAIELSRAVIRNIKQNLFWAFFYNTIGIPLAAGIFFPLFGLKGRRLHSPHRPPPP